MLHTLEMKCSSWPQTDHSQRHQHKPCFCRSLTAGPCSSHGISFGHPVVRMNPWWSECNCICQVRHSQNPACLDQSQPQVSFCPGITTEGLNTLRLHLRIQAVFYWLSHINSQIICNQWFANCLPQKVFLAGIESLDEQLFQPGRQESAPVYPWADLQFAQTQC